MPGVKPFAIDTGDYFRADLLAGRTALVTGGGKGIGLVMALALARVGAHVVLAARTRTDLEDSVARMRAEGLEASWQRLDIRDPGQVEDVVGRVVDERGRIDVLVNNAGGQFPVKAEDLSPNGWKSVVDLNLNGTFYMCRAVGRHMIARGGGGKIINVIASFVHRSSAGVIHSGASRAGVAHMTRTLALEWAQHGIQVNAIGPQFLTRGAKIHYPPAIEDFIKQATPAGRWARSDEMAAWTVMLAGPMSDYATGDLIWLDGGNLVGAGINYLGSEVLEDAAVVRGRRRSAEEGDLGEGEGHP